MNIALAGTGRMGSAVAEAAADRGWSVIHRFNSARPFEALGELCGSGRPDAVIDFSVPEVLQAHIETGSQLGIPMVIGTTGWSDRMDDVRRLVRDQGGTVLYAPNFSLGVAMLFRAVRAVAPMLNMMTDFDVSVHEVHHSGKRDSPSGTALRLAEVVCKTVDRKTAVQTGPGSASSDSHMLQVTAARIGREFGHHAVWIDGPSDRLLLSHDARSRRGFAEGALAAGEWLQGRLGFFTIDDMLNDWLSQKASSAETAPYHEPSIVP